VHLPCEAERPVRHPVDVVKRGALRDQLAPF
jgi:hypothetical protein